VTTIRSLLRDHVALQARSVDRIYLQAYVPRLMSEGLLVRFLLDRGAIIPSPALPGQIGARYVAAIERFAAREGIPIVRFRRGESKEELARPYLEAAKREGRFGCVVIGVAQERASVWRGWRRGGSDGHPHFEFGRQSALPNTRVITPVAGRARPCPTRHDRPADTTRPRLARLRTRAQRPHQRRRPRRLNKMTQP
jgi:hypothetical protein